LATAGTKFFQIAQSRRRQNVAKNKIQ